MTSSIENPGLSTDLQILDLLLDVKDKFLLDAGCGDMHLSRELATRGAHILAIDPDPVQAEINRQAPLTANIRFAETGANVIAVEDKSVDGVLFSYSLHHIPENLYSAVFQEVQRILKPDGFLYVLEPVADGDLNEITRLFHDEEDVRAAAQRALNTMAIPYFQSTRIIQYTTPIQYGSWDEFVESYAEKSYNTNYTANDVRANSVREQFLVLGSHTDFYFESPKKVTLLTGPVSSQHYRQGIL